MLLKDSIKNIPTNPGVYYFKNKNADIIYIGKAKSLKKRVFSYFNKSNTNTKNKIMISNAKSVEFLVVNNEVEALLTEANMIKEYKPKYNICLKDDKTFPYIVITNEFYPRVEIIRKKKLLRDGNTYFGPYTDVSYLREVLKVLHHVFQIRTCSFHITSKSIEQKKHKICLDYHIEKCEGPCEGLVSSVEYNKMIKYVKHFLKGQNKQIRNMLKNKMKKSSKKMIYEEASRYRDQLFAIDSFCKKQKKISYHFKDRDIVHIEKEDGCCVGFVMRIRNGLLIGKEKFNIQVIDQVYEDVLNNFLIQYYTSTFDIPLEIIIDRMISQKEEIEEWLFSINKSKVIILSPIKGDKRNMMNLCIKNTKFALKELISRKIKRKEYIPQTLSELQSCLNLPVLPKRIEAFDNSNLQGTNPVAGLVCFVNGNPLKKEYRHFNIKSVNGIDDFESMREVVFRRYSRQIQEKKVLPDLILIDGGKGQLSSAKSSLDKLGLGYIPVIGLAKRLEEVFKPDIAEPQNIPKTSPGLHLLRQIRDEVHRFAITFHRSKRDKKMTLSVFEDIPGMGKKRVQKLWEVFESLEDIKAASADDIKIKCGFSEGLAESISDKIS